MKTNKWMVMCVTSLGTLMAGISIGSLNVANPLLRQIFDVGIEHIQWTSTIYLLIVCSIMLLLGRIGDRVGGHKVYLIGLLIFMAGSVFCGLSTSFLLLLIGRAIQAVGGAMIMATGTGLLMVAFPLNQRGMAMGIGVLVVSIGNMCGPSIGGLLLTHFDWNIIFFFNLPFGVLSLLLGLRFLRVQVSKEAAGNKLDIRGASLLSACVTSLIISLSGGFEGCQWFALALVVFLPLFYCAEKHHSSPLWDFGLMSKRRFSLGNLITFISYFASMLLSFLLPFFMQEVWEFSVGLTGLFMMVSPICMAVSAPLAGILSDKIGAMKLMPLSLIMLICGIALVMLWQTQPNYPLFVASLMLMGLGMGILNTPNTSEIMTAAGKRYANYAGSFVATNRNLAFCLGTAASAGIFSALLRYFELSAAYADAYLAAIHGIAIISAVLTVLSLAVCLWLKRSNTNEPESSEQPRAKE